MIFLSYVLAFTGFVFLSLAMKRHYKQVQLKSAQARQPLGKLARVFFRVTGIVFLVFSLLLCTTAIGVSVGLVQWAGILTLAALQTSLLLTYRPWWLLLFLLPKKSTLWRK
jgi:hypothetical protein